MRMKARVQNRSMFNTCKFTGSCNVQANLLKRSKYFSTSYKKVAGPGMSSSLLRTKTSIPSLRKFANSRLRTCFSSLRTFWTSTVPFSLNWSKSKLSLIIMTMKIQRHLLVVSWTQSLATRRDYTTKIGLKSAATKNQIGSSTRAILEQRYLHCLK